MRGTRSIIVTAAVGAAAVLGVGGVAAATSGSGSSPDSAAAVSAPVHVKRAEVAVRALADETTTTADPETTTTAAEETSTTLADDTTTTTMADVTTTTVATTPTTIKGDDDHQGCDGKGHDGKDDEAGDNANREHLHGLERAAQVRQDMGRHHSGSHDGLHRSHRGGN